MADEVFLTVPYINILRTEQGWPRDPKVENRYSVIRCHYMLKSRQLDDPIKMGEVIGGAASVKGISQKTTYSKEYEVTTVDLKEAIQESLAEEESVAEFTTSLSGNIGNDIVGKLTGEVKGRSQGTLRDSFKSTFKVQASVSHRREEVFTFEYSIDPDKFDATDRVVVAKAYKKYAYDLYLIFADYLIVEYRRPPWGVRLRRIKRPAALDDPRHPDKHPNIIKLNLPLASILYWQQLSDTLLLAKEKEHRNEVPDPFELEVGELRGGKTPFAKIDPRPNLYELSNDVFPPKRF